MSAPSRAAARLALLASTLVWGTTFVVVQRAIEEIAVFHLIAFRFGLAALLLLPLARRGWTRRTLIDGAAIGVLLFAGFVLQTAGLLWTTPSRSAFLTALSVLPVPFIGWLTGTERPRLGPLAGVLCAALGLWVLYVPGSGGEPFNRGDALTVASAVIFAGWVVLSGRVTRRNTVLPLAAAQFTVVALLALPSLVIDPPTGGYTKVAVGAVLLTGVMATALAFLAQLYAQQRLSAVEASVILTLEPVVAAAFSVALGVEPATWTLLLGGALVVLAMLLAEIGGRPQPPSPTAPPPA